MNTYALLALFAWTCCQVTFAADPIVLFEGEDEQAPKQPQAYVSSQGKVHVAFGVEDQVYYCSVEGENTTSPRAACRIPNMSLGLRRGPRIAESGTAIVISAIGGTQGKGRDGDILTYRSLDHGQSWLGPIKVNDVEGSAREGMHAMTANRDGVLWCVWLDLREKGTRLFVSKSTDHGANWSKNVLVYRSPERSICECCHPSIVANHDTVHVLFRNSVGGNRDMYLVSSRDGGTSFGDAVRLGQSNWPLNACPMDGGMVAMNDKEELSTAWRRDKSIYRATSKSGFESLLGSGEQPWVASDGVGFYTVWTNKRELLLVGPNDSSASKISDTASFPVIVAASKPNPSVYVLWEKRVDQKTKIMSLRIR